MCTAPLSKPATKCHVGCKRYRHITVYDCLVYAEAGEPLVSFVGSYQGRIATTPGASTGTPIERLFIPQGYEVPISEFSQEEKISYWSKGEIWQAFRRHLELLRQPDEQATDETPQ